MIDVGKQFRDAIQSAGLTAPDVIEADGELHRFPSNGNRGDDAGWYVFHDDGIPAGAFGDWRTGVSEKWRADIGRKLTPAEEAGHRTKMDAMRRERQAEQPATDDHPYLQRKAIKANGARLQNGALVIPMRDATGALCSLQFIDADGGKKFLTDGKVAGCYFSIGALNGVIHLAEGYATAATIHEATGDAVAVAFNAGNLEAVAKALRQKFPDAKLIVCADNDAATDGNPGLTKSREAAQVVGGMVAVPDFGADRPEGASDFNDLAALRGPEAVRACIDGAQTVSRESAPAGDSDS